MGNTIDSYFTEIIGTPRRVYPSHKSPDDLKIGIDRKFCNVYFIEHIDGTWSTRCIIVRKLTTELIHNLYALFINHDYTSHSNYVSLLDISTMKLAFNIKEIKSESLNDVQHFLDTYAPKINEPL